MIVRSGTALVIEVTGTAGSWWNPRDAIATVNGIRADVIASLLPFMSVDTLTIADRGITDIGEWDYRAHALVRPKSDYGSADDVASIVANAFYQATGALPTATVGLGTQPNLEPATNPIGDLLSGVQGTASLIVIALVIIVGLIAFGPAVRVQASV